MAFPPIQALASEHTTDDAIVDIQRLGLMLVALPNAFGDAATNMAMDAALLQTLPEGLAAFRHYGWLEPSATFGYAQHYAAVVSELAPGHEPTEGAQANRSDTEYIEGRASSHPTLCRRLTGGGIVDHRNDWTYALIIHASLPAASIQATVLYERIHRAIRLSLQAIGIEGQLAPCPKHCESAPQSSQNSNPVSSTAQKATGATASQCFVTPAANDVLRLDGRKIAGAAMKRNRHGLLVQGSLDREALPDAFDFRAFQEHLLSQLARALDLPAGELGDIGPLFDSPLTDSFSKVMATKGSTLPDDTPPIGTGAQPHRQLLLRQALEREKQRFASEAWNRRR